MEVDGSRKRARLRKPQAESLMRWILALMLSPLAFVTCTTTALMMPLR